MENENAPHPMDTVIAGGQANLAVENQKRKKGRPPKVKVPELVDPAAADQVEGDFDLADYSPLINQGSVTVSEVLVEVTGCEKIAISDEERGLLCESLNPALQKLLPATVGGQASPYLSALFAVGSLFLAKYLIYGRWLREQNAKKQATAAPVQPDPTL